MKVKVIIKQCPIDSFSYFQWFLVGLYQLEKEGKIRLKFKIPIWDRIVLFWFNNKYITGGLRRFVNKFRKIPRYNLLGEILNTDGKKYTFAIDSKDSPFIYTVKDLNDVDAYFKLQCPISIDKDGFEISTGIKIPWQDIIFQKQEGINAKYARRVAPEVYKKRNKIFPGMIGPRRLGWTCKKNVLLKNYENYLKSKTVPKTKKLCAYFGNALFPQRSENITSYDLDWESDLMAFLGEEHTHPNEKRAVAVCVMQYLKNDLYDGRLIHDENGHSHPDLVIPLENFCDFIASFEYNLNISGFRLSIPNRFIESFISGTAIFTDKLSVKWYLPFDEEVIESVKMGYEKPENVDWETWEEQIKNLPHVDASIIQKRFKDKWQPSVFATYVINSTMNSENLKN